MHNRSAFMRSVWQHFRRVANPRQAFCRKLFGEVLRFMWKSQRVRLEAERERQANLQSQHSAVIEAAPARPLSPMEARIDGLKYLSARYRIDLMAAEIRAEYAHA